MARRTPRTRVLLLAMPWARLEHPSIQLGLLKALLDRAGIASAQAHLYLDFSAHLARCKPQLGSVDYDEVANHYFAGDWIFSVPPFSPAGANDEDYIAFLRRDGAADAFLRNIVAMQQAVPEFLDDTARRLFALQPDVVGFTTTFGQTVASLVMALVLKQRLPHVKIVLGGANCDGAMGEALHREFPWIDVVVRGDAEPVFVDLVQDLLQGLEPRRRPGLCFRTPTGVVVVPQASELPRIGGERAYVDYDDYFERLESHPCASELSSRVSIPFESSRGCWWGEKHHCTFCGLNGTAMRFRAMEPESVLNELLHLARKYQRLEFKAVDNIIDKRLFKTLIPKLVALGSDFKIFYEVKANLRKSELALLKAAGITEIQPGIESLNTAVLRRMRKGTTALQNIRLLKWCAAYGIQVYWNIIYNLPGDTSAEYEESAKVALDCLHLCAPSLIPLQVERFSPYHDQPESFGIEVTRPKGHYRFSYPVAPRALMDIAYAFDHRERDTIDREPGLCLLRDAVKQWQAAEEQGAPCRLSFARGPGFSVICDRRPGREHADYRLGALETMIYDACDSGLGVDVICAKLGAASPGASAVLDFVTSLLEAGLVYCEEGRYLSLAVEVSPGRGSNTSAAEEVQHGRALSQIAVVVEAR